MSRLEKKAWVNIAGVIVCIIIAGPGIWWMVNANVKGPIVLFSFLISGLLGGLLSYFRNVRHWAKLDEREKNISQRALVLSSLVFIVFMYCSSFIIFFVIGARNGVPAYVLPVTFICGVLLMALVQSAMVLIQFAKERNDEQRPD